MHMAAGWSLSRAGSQGAPGSRVSHRGWKLTSFRTMFLQKERSHRRTSC